MATVRIAERERLRARGQLACPRQLKYPIDTYAHVRSALSYYGHKNTVKCPGGRERICRAARKFGIESTVCGRRRR
jgi:hypothetical protein